MTKGISWFLSLPLLLLLFLSLSCCKSSEGTPAATGGEKASTDQAAGMEGGSVYPAVMQEALARGKKENKMVIIELYDKACNYCAMMNGSLANKQVLDALKDVIDKRITVEDKGVVEEFGLMESPSWLFFKPDGEFMEPFLQGFRSPDVFAAEINNYKRRMAGQEELPVPQDPHPDYGKG